MNAVAIIPAYKPDEHLKTAVRELFEAGFRVIAVNDGSGKESDAYFESVEKYAVVLRHEKNLGKGRALKTAMQYIYDNFCDTDCIVTADADGQHRPEHEVSDGIFITEGAI